MIAVQQANCDPVALVKAHVLECARMSLAEHYLEPMYASTTEPAFLMHVGVVAQYLEVSHADAAEILLDVPRAMRSAALAAIDG